jgi:hypothetical protein
MHVSCSTFEKVAIKRKVRSKPECKSVKVIVSKIELSMKPESYAGVRLWLSW